MRIIEIDSLSHPGVEVFSTLTEAQLRNRLEPQKGIFIAESPKVIHVALNAGYEPLPYCANASTLRAMQPRSSSGVETSPSIPENVNSWPHLPDTR